MVLNGGNMRTNVVITDDFYINVDEVREFALKQEFTLQANYPGKRTRTFINDSTKELIQKILFPVAGKVTQWNDVDGLTGSFQITTADDRSWIHTDKFNSWAGVCYLTPNAPLSSGTGLFINKQTQSFYEDESNINARDITKWEMVDRIGNRYNRMILYRSDIYHSSLDYFGTDLYTGRLFQVFFINTEF